jgi:hypothetical protein
LLSSKDEEENTSILVFFDKVIVPLAYPFGINIICGFSELNTHENTLDLGLGFLKLSILTQES